VDWKERKREMAARGKEGEYDGCGIAKRLAGKGGKGERKKRKEKKRTRIPIQPLITPLPRSPLQRIPSTPSNTLQHVLDNLERRRCSTLCVFVFLFEKNAQSRNDRVVVLH